MKDFISEIKKIPTDGLIYCLSEKSIDMFRKNECLMPVTIPVIHNGQRKILTVTLTAWDILDMEFLSIKESNDYRRSSKKVPVEVLVDLYRDYDNERSAKEGIFQNVDADGVFRTLMGMTAEQFAYEDLYWLFEKFSRDYYILFAAENFEHRSIIDTDAIVREIFGIPVNDYVLILVTVFWLCCQHPDPLSAPEELYSDVNSAVLTVENLSNFIKYYSCTYQNLRTSSLKKQLLYSKPFIKTQRTGEYFASSIFPVAMLVGNGLYWLVRNYYCKQGTQVFVNTFGCLFEDYIKDIASKYCKPSEWTTLSTGSRKSADFTFDLGSLTLLVESKSALICLDVKQQIPNLHNADIFFERTISKAYKQLNSSYVRLSVSSKNPIIKIILLYDQFSNSAIVEEAAHKILGSDSSCFIMTIREFEILLYLHQHNKETEQQILDEILKSSRAENSRKNIPAIYKDLAIDSNPHFEEEMDYFSKLMNNFKDAAK